VGRRGGVGVTHVDWIHVAIMVRVHMAIREETVRKQGEENEFGKSQKLIA
jgi:hypothetical protein